MREGPGAAHLAAVFYGRGVILGLDDAAWRTYALGEAARKRGEVLETAGEGNPFTNELAALANRGVSCFVCDNALDDWATYLAVVQGAGSSVGQVRDDGSFPGHCWCRPASSRSTRHRKRISRTCRARCRPPPRQSLSARIV